MRLRYEIATHSFFEKIWGLIHPRKPGGRPSNIGLSMRNSDAEQCCALKTGVHAHDQCAKCLSHIIVIYLWLAQCTPIRSAPVRMGSE